MTNTTTMPPVIGWKVGPNWNDTQSASNEEVCQAFGVSIPEWLDPDDTDLFYACWDNREDWGCNDNFAGFLYVLTLKDTTIAYELYFPDLTCAKWYSNGVQDTMEETIGTCGSVFAYKETTQTDFAAVKELLLTAVKQTADDLGISTEDHDKWKEENAGNVLTDFDPVVVASLTVS